MTFDDGVVAICDVSNTAAPGEMPIKKLNAVQELSYEEETVGITRYYEAIKTDQLIEMVIVVPREIEISINQMAVLETGEQYEIRMVQAATDENGLKILRLSLERNGESYEVDWSAVRSC